MNKLSISLITACILMGLYVQAEEVDLSGFDDEPMSVVQENTTSSDVMDGFDDAPVSAPEETKSTEDEILDGFEETPSKGTKVEQVATAYVTGFTGKLTEQVAYSLYNDKPHDNISSVRSSLFLDYEHKFENNFKFKVNAKAYYDAIYAIKGHDDFSQDELHELESEVELFDAYIEGSITDNFDMKLGRQVVVWGRSDTIRVTDVLNPLDNRRPGMVDIEDLRLPVAMAKFDYFMGDWRVTPLAILEQRFTKNPPFGSAFYPLPIAAPGDESYSDITYAVSVGGEFTGWDINFYAARLLDDDGHIVFSPSEVKKEHEKVNMFGTAINVLTGSWLFKTELAYFDGLQYTMAPHKTFTRTDVLLGFEYKGISDTLVSYDVVARQLGEYDERLLLELNPLHKQDYQHAFRISSDFLHATLTANYLISLFGEKLDRGGFQRAWLKYELGEGMNTNIGAVDYIGGSFSFDAIKTNDMVFADISYNF